MSSHRKPAVPSSLLVSTTGQGHDVTMQTRELQKYAEARGWTVTSEYVDEGFFWREGFAART